MGEVPKNEPLPKRHWFRFAFRLRTLFVVVTVFSCWLEYQVNWIRQRRELKAEGDALLEITGTYANGSNSDDLDPIGPTIGQRLLWLLGEPSVPTVFVFHVFDDETKPVVGHDGRIYRGAMESIDFPKVRRARSLFPEAEITAVAIHRSEIEGPDAFLKKVSGIISE